METLLLKITWVTYGAMVVNMVAVGILVLVMLLCTIAVCFDGLMELIDYVKKAVASPRSKDLEMNDDRDQFCNPLRSFLVPTYKVLHV